MAQCQTPRLRDHPTKRSTAGRVNKLLEVTGILEQDVSDMIAQVTACEIETQEKAGNSLTNFVINNRPGKTIRDGIGVATSLGRRARGNANSGELVYKTKSLFGSVEDMIPAAQKTLELLVALTRFRSGRARGSYRIYLGNTAMRDSPGRFVGIGGSGLSALEGKLTSESAISIVGPYVVYGRKLYWNPIGGKKVNKRLPGTRAASRLGIKITGGFIGTETIHSDVKKRMRRKAAFKALSFGDPFYRTSDSPMVGDRRVPAITIQPKKRGRLI